MHPQLLLLSLQYLTQTILARLDQYFGAESTAGAMRFPPEPDWEQNDAALAKFIQKEQLNRDEVLLLLLALAPHIQANYYEAVLLERLPQSGDFPDFGGVKGKQYRGMLPTGETALFVLAGNDLTQRLKLQEYFSAAHSFTKRGILWLEEPSDGEPRMSGRILLSQEYVDLFTTGKVQKPRFSGTFPAELVEIKMDWSDLVLNAQTLSEVKGLLTWLKHGQVLLDDEGMGKRLKPGFHALFHGPPGTGKTLTAGLLGKHTGRDVYKVDLSMVVSKFIGETEKNLANLFDRAENKDWILFFDEADALFGKRTNVRDAHDKYANQEVSFLLQRVESYAGLVILASNFRSNIDDAFSRRFQSIIHFPMPRSNERLTLWEKSFPEKFHCTGLSLETLAQKYELSGASILNIVQYASLMALERGDRHILPQDIREGVVKEYAKDGKTAP